MIVVIADTSGLLAALDSCHPEHQASNEAIMVAGLLVMSPLLLAEIDHVATRELGRITRAGAVLTAGSCDGQDKKNDGSARAPRERKDDSVHRFLG